MSGPRSYPGWKTFLWLLAFLVGMAFGFFPCIVVALAWEYCEKEYGKAAKAEFEEWAKVRALTERAEHHRKKFRGAC